MYVKSRVVVVVPVFLPTLHGPPDRQFAVDGVDIRIIQSMTFNPPALVRFWRAFQEVRTEIEAGTVITLPEGTFLLGDPTQGPRIYIRHCYPKLWNVCWKMIPDEATKTPHLVILGNPGIGKTYFGYVMLLYLARLGKTVVYQSRKSGQRFLFSQDVVAEGSEQDFIPILKQRTTFYIVDAVEPRDYPAKTILVTSPGSVWNEFNKYNCQFCYMPVWSWDEIFTCRRLMYSDKPEVLVQDCFRRWGGIARYVLHYAEIEEQQALLEGVFDTVTLDWLEDACGKFGTDPEQVSHRLLHYRVKEDFTKSYFVFASQYVLEEIYRRLYNKNSQKMLEYAASI
ncbi:hypothetical protein V7S43_018102 [Phytophthora oleae]|uniref:Crinkler (CRN) family protein n=1 Tax=Phytophthora oleae TaxID=2107226 RepID=A0ABD3EVC4_9STRA